MIISNPADIQFMLDTISSTQGAFLFKGATDWEALGAQAFSVPLSNGGSADPVMWPAAAL